MPVYKYTNLTSETTEMYVGELYIPANGLTTDYVIADLEEVVGIYLNKYIDGVLSNGSKIAVVDGREEVVIAANQTVRVVGSTGTTALGSVTVTSLPSIPAGANAIGSITVTSLPALPTGTNSIGNIGTVATLTNALPTGANTIGKVNIGTKDVQGAHANAWNAIAVAINGVSTAVSVSYVPAVSVFGNVSAATNITVQVSQNGTNWYDTDIVKNIAAAGDFYISVPNMGAAQLRLKSSAAATITATIAGK